MKCPCCGKQVPIFLGMWYIELAGWWILSNHYGCPKCRVMWHRPAPENDFYHLKEVTGDITLRPTAVPGPGERRLTIVDGDPGFYVREG